MTALRRHPQGSRRAVGSSPGPPHKDLAGAAAMLGTQSQPTDEILLVRKLAHVQTQLAQEHQGRRLADAFDLGQIDACDLKQQRPRAETNLVLLRLALAQTRRQRLALALVLHAAQTGFDLRLTLAQLLLIKLVELQRLLDGKQMLHPPLAMQRL